jgi:hypothetical protein
MVGIDRKVFRRLLPALTDVFVGREASERFAPFGKVVGHQERLEVGLARLLGLLGICLHRRFLEPPVQAFHLPIRPGMGGFGPPLVNARLMTNAIKDLGERVAVALPIGTWATMISQHGVDRGG